MIQPITRVGLARLNVPLKEPFSNASGKPQQRPTILVALETADGLVGIGECSPPMENAANAKLVRCWDDLAGVIIPSLLGRLIEDLETIARIATSWTNCQQPAVAGAETACWDLLGQQTHQSLAQLLGASEPRIIAGVDSGLSVGLYPNVVDLVRAIEPHLAEGYQRLTLAIAPGRDLEFVEAVLQHYPDLLLAIDAGSRFGPESAEAFRQLDQFQPLMIINPYPAQAVDELQALQAELASPICLEATDTEAIQRGACRMARLSIQQVGGLRAARERHDFCQKHGVACCVSALPELGVGVTQAIHLATLPNCKDPCDISPPVRWFVDDVVIPPIEPNGPGRFSIPSRSGLGILLDPLAVRRYQIQSEEWRSSEL